MISSEKIAQAAKDGKLMPSAAENLTAWSKAGLPDWA